MRKVTLVTIFLALVLAASPVSAGIFGDLEPLAPPPSAEQMLGTVGVRGRATPPLYGIGSDETTEIVVEEGTGTPFVWWGATLIYENSVGIGSFVGNEEQRREYWEMLWSARAKLYLFHKKMFIQARLDMTQPIIDNYDAETTENLQFTISDTILTIMSPAFYTEPTSGIRFGAWMDFLFPSSLESQFARRYVSWRTGVLIGRNFKIGAIDGDFDLMYQFRFTKNFHESATPKTADPYISGTDRLGNPVVKDWGVGISTNFGIMNRLTATLTFLNDFYLSLDFVIYNNWHYDTKDEVGCPPDMLAVDPSCSLRHGVAADPSETRAADLTLATMELGYAPLPYLTLALGVTSYQPAMKDDNSGLRFPFNFEDASRNFTTVYLDVIGSY